MNGIRALLAGFAEVILLRNLVETNTLYVKGSRAVLAADKFSSILAGVTIVSVLPHRTGCLSIPILRLRISIFRFPASLSRFLNTLLALFLRLV